MTGRHLPDDLLAALTVTNRKPGWNSRPREVQRFDLGTCTVYVVPFRRWVYRRQERQAEAWQAAQA